MPVRLGDIELRSVQDVRAADNRTLVELRVPGQSGSVFQDLGRAPATVVLAGLLTGEGAADTLERLRSAYQKARALAFASDIAIGTEMTEIVIADLIIKQDSGYRDRYRYTITIREHVEPPENVAANQAAVDAAVQSDGAAWAGDAAAAGDALADPAGLADALANKPELLNHMSADQLGDAVGGSLESLGGDKLGSIMDSVAAADPAKAGGFLDRIKGMGKLGAFVDKLISVGKTVLAVARKVGGILMDVGDVMDLVKIIKEVGAAAKALWQDGAAFADRWSLAAIWTPPADEPFAVPEPTPRDMLNRVRELVGAVARLVDLEIIKRVRDLARGYGLGGAIDTAARALITAVEFVQRVALVLREIAAGVTTLWLLAELGGQLGAVVVATEDLLDDETRASAEQTLRTLRWAAALLESAPTPVDVDALRAEFTALIAAFRHYTLGDAALPAVVPAAPKALPAGAA